MACPSEFAAIPRRCQPLSAGPRTYGGTNRFCVWESETTRSGSSAVRTNNEINSCSEPCLRSRWALAPSIGEVPSSSERAACIAPNAEKFDNQKPRAASFLFVRRGTQSYDEFVAAVPLRPRLGMMLRMINTSDILSIGENSTACVSSGRTSVTR